MSLFIRSFAPLRASSRAIQRPVAAFSTSSIRTALSEADRDRQEKIEHHKQDSVKRAKDGQGEWKPELASASEQGVAADKNNMSMDEMQKMGEKKAEQGQQPSGSSSNKN